MMSLDYSAVKPIFKSKDVFSKEMLKYSRCLLTISVGQEVHESEKFLATIRLVNDHFASCVVLIDDTVQRHTMALQRKEDPDFFYEQSLKEGDLWLFRNQTHLNHLTIPHEIIRWNRWLEHPSYEEKNEAIKTLMEIDPLYKKIFIDTVSEFLRRYYSRLARKATAFFEKDFILCLNYLIEECTALCLWPDLDCHFEVYPSKRNLAMDETHKRLVLPKYPNLLNALSIKFKNRKQLKPQHFELLEK